MPSWRLPEITLPGPVPAALVTPPMVVPEALSFSTPLWSFPTPEETPVTLRPIRLPRIWLLSALVVGVPGNELVIRTPESRLPEMMLPAPGAVPPITLPSPRLGSAVIPLADRPIRLPVTTLPVVPALLNKIPLRALPEMMLAAEPSRFAAPMVLFEGPGALEFPDETRIPSPPLGSAYAPARSVPIRLPRTLLPVVVVPPSCRPCIPLPETTFPLRMLSEPSGLSPLTPPMVLFADVPTLMPTPMLATLLVPLALVPTRLPRMTFPALPVSFPLTSMPTCPLPDTTFPPRTVMFPVEWSAPPMVFAESMTRLMPPLLLPRLTGGPIPMELPVAKVVPMALPEMTLASDPGAKSIPYMLATIRLPAPPAVPPIVTVPPIVFCLPLIKIPLPWLPRGWKLDGSSILPGVLPMMLPRISSFEVPVIRLIPLPVFAEIRFPSPAPVPP